MRTRLRIKGKILWRLCTLVLIGVIFTFCHTYITSVTMPATATVGQTVDIDVLYDLSVNYGDSNPRTANLVLAVLVPKGWKGAQNMTATYTSDKGNGNMVMMPAGTIAANTNGLTWEAALKKMFGTAGNLIDDLDWVVMQTNVPYSYVNGNKFTGHIYVKLKVGADDNPTIVKLSYVLANTNDGLKGNDGLGDGAPYGPTAVYYNQYIGSCFTVTGGSGDLVDFCNPQLTTIDPPKSLDNDFVTISYNNNVTPTALAGKPEVYLCATATMSDGSTVTVCDRSAKTLMKQTTTNSGLYQLTLWPRKYFSATETQTVVSMSYFITDQTGAIQVGYGNTAAPFSYKFKCN